MVFFLRLSEIAFQLLFVAFVATQVFYPMIVGTRTFPMFRKARREVNDQIVAAHESAELRELRSELKSFKEKK